MSKIGLDRDRIDQAKQVAEHITSPIAHYVERHSTVSIERSLLRMMGVTGPADAESSGQAPQGSYPLVNRLVDSLGAQRLQRGAAYWFGLACAHHPDKKPAQLAQDLASGKISWDSLTPLPLPQIEKICQSLVKPQLDRLRDLRDLKNKRPFLNTHAGPLKYVIVATGNIHEDILQAKAAVEMGADIIAVIRSTAQSLLDYVPEGATTEGYGGTFATQENFRLMREALYEVEKKIKRRVGLTNYSSGLCMPEIAVMGALEGVDYLLNDAMYGILFRDINMKRNFVDQNFARRICALSGITIQTGEDNYLTTADSFKYWYQVLASHFINQAFARRAGLPDTALALGHAFEINPWLEDSMLYEWAQAQLVRELFPRCPIKYMPPTKHKTGDVFFSYLYDGMFNLAGAMTQQSILLLGMHTEAIHNPHIQDRFLSLKNARYVFTAAKSAKDEILFQPHGKVARRARQVFDDALRLLQKIKIRGLWNAIEEGAFANVRRGQDEGKGLEGVFHKDRDYYTPLHQYMTPKSALGHEERATRDRDFRGMSRRESSRYRDRDGGKERERDHPRERQRSGDRERTQESHQQRERSRDDRQRDQGRNSQRDRGRSRDSARKDVPRAPREKTTLPQVQNREADSPLVNPQAVRATLQEGPLLLAPPVTEKVSVLSEVLESEGRGLEISESITISMGPPVANTVESQSEMPVTTSSDEAIEKLDVVAPLEEAPVVTKSGEVNPDSVLETAGENTKKQAGASRRHGRGRSGNSGRSRRHGEDNSRSRRPTTRRPLKNQIQEASSEAEKIPEKAQERFAEPEVSLAIELPKVPESNSGVGSGTERLPRRALPVEKKLEARAKEERGLPRAATPVGESVQPLPRRPLKLDRDSGVKTEKPATPQVESETKTSTQDPDQS